MKIISRLVALMTLMLVFVCIPETYAQKNGADAALGTWVTGTGKGHVQLYKQGNKYYGKIVWLQEPNDEQGKPKVDKTTRILSYSRDLFLGWSTCGILNMAGTMNGKTVIFMTHRRVRITAVR